MALNDEVIVFMIEEVKKSKRDEVEIINSLKGEIDHWKTHLNGCDQLKDEYEREKQENEKLKQKIQSQSEIIGGERERK